jgi:hypothetical protein
MSDTEQVEQVEKGKITKPKSPGRIAAGKKLAEMNKKNKTKKIEESDTWNINPGYVIGGLGLTIAAGSLYLQYKQQKVAPITQPAPITQLEPKSKIPEME